MTYLLKLYVDGLRISRHDHQSLRSIGDNERDGYSLAQMLRSLNRERREIWHEYNEPLPVRQDSFPLHPCKFQSVLITIRIKLRNVH